MYGFVVHDMSEPYVAKNGQVNIPTVRTLGCEWLGYQGPLIGLVGGKGCHRQDVRQRLWRGISGDQSAVKDWGPRRVQDGAGHPGNHRNPRISRCPMCPDHFEEPTFLA